jgi:hypothetical protein
MGASFEPQVEPPVDRLRIGFVVALLLAIGAAVVVLLVRIETSSAGTSWWESTGRLHCTPLEAESFLHDTSVDDADRATCYAIAGKIDRARQVLRSMPESDRVSALTNIFSIADPIADNGDDLSAGPIMLLVVELQPDHYMAAFHAGMAEFALGHDDVARVQLDKFLTLYQAHDMWRQRAETALQQIAIHAPLAARQAHFR